MIVKRETKRKVKRTFSVILVAAAAIVMIVAIFFVGKAAIPLVSFQSQEKLIRPLGKMTTMSELKKKLSDKNIIFSSFSESSESGVFVGRIKEGPTVLFSQNQDAKWQVVSLSLILQRTTVDNKKPVLIDITGNRPIVKY